MFVKIKAADGLEEKPAETKPLPYIRKQKKVLKRKMVKKKTNRTENWSMSWCFGKAERTLPGRGLKRKTVENLRSWKPNHYVWMWKRTAWIASILWMPGIREAGYHLHSVKGIIPSITDLKEFEGGTLIKIQAWRINSEYAKKEKVLQDA